MVKQIYINDIKWNEIISHHKVKSKLEIQFNPSVPIVDTRSPEKRRQWDSLSKFPHHSQITDLMV